MTEREKEIGRAVWLEERRTGLGGSDAAAILGMSPWGSPLSVWLDKRGELPQKEESEWMYWGTANEDAIAYRYSRDTGRKLWKPGGVIRHRDHAMILGTPDRLVIDEKRGVEIKTVDRYAAGEWGETFTDQCPNYYLLQCVVYMAITGFPVWDIAVLIGGNDFRIYTVVRDPALENAVIGKMLDFWETHIVQGIRPDIDGSAAAGEWLARRFPKEKSEELIEADHDVQMLASILRIQRNEIALREGRKGELENKIKALIGDATGFRGEGWRITWKATKGRQVVDWKEIAVEAVNRLMLMDQGDLARMIVQKNTRREEGSRRFLFMESGPKQIKGGGDE